MTPTGAAELEDAATETPSPHGPPVVKIAVGLAALVALVWLGREAGGHVPRFAEWVEGLGPWGPAVFVGATRWPSWRSYRARS